MRLFSDYLMLPLFGLLGETPYSVPAGRLCVSHTISGATPAFQRTR
jgi:hypothetical protein